MQNALKQASTACLNRARDWVAANLTLEGKTRVSLFETTIRIVGGLVSAYDLSHDDLFLHKARGLSDKLMRAFNHTQSGVCNSLMKFLPGMSTANLLPNAVHSLIIRY